ncbi:MAG TPA: primosomal protein N' [Gammaproteobacteria bacterium]
MNAYTGAIWRVAVLSPLRKSFDYLPPKTGGDLKPAIGARVRVPFGRGSRVGVLIELASYSEVPAGKLRRVTALLDEEPLIDATFLGMLRWTADYYHHPIGEVIFSAMPPAVRRGRILADEGVVTWRFNAAGAAANEGELARAPRQRALFFVLSKSKKGVSEEDLAASMPGWRAAMRGLNKRGWVESFLVQAAPAPCAEALQPRQLNEAQNSAVDQVIGARGRFESYLLDGVTGSGKTEVYLELIDRLTALGEQALVLIPEIGLTPQIVARFRQRLTRPVVVLHSALSESARLHAWRCARDGRAAVVIGTRSAVFTPLRKPGLFIVDEEQDPSYKQQDGLRYSARDLAVVRARLASSPIVLGSATPSLESVYNVRKGRYTELRLPQRAGTAQQPSLEVVDLRGRHLRAGLSDVMIEALRDCLRNDEQAILFINRRGFAPAYLCSPCGWVAECPRCDANMVLHRNDAVLLCHHCGSKKSPPEACPECGGGDFRLLGLGTERIVDCLTDEFEGARIRRIDRDSTRRKGVFESLLDAMHGGEIDIVVGTQMVAKGHHFPSVTLVGVVDADSGLFGFDFRAGERMAQLLLQVAGRAGRGDKPGRVLIQTHHPSHPLLRALVTSGYRAFAENALEEREEAGLPPHAHMGLLRAEAAVGEVCEQFLQSARDEGEELSAGDVSLLGPVPAPMARRAGRHRAQLFLESSKRAPLHGFLKRWLPRVENLSLARRVRWSIDIDPQEIV